MEALKTDRKECGFFDKNKMSIIAFEAENMKKKL